ncbi:MAG: glycogen/starch synthase [Chloroflexota bacterium]
MRVLYLAAEAVPLIKVGGLGDVAGSLPRALRRLPVKPDVRLVIPFHGGTDRSSLKVEPVAAFTLPTTTDTQGVEVFAADVDGLPVYLIAGSMLPPEAPVYAHPREDAYKYTFFSLASLELARVLDWWPDILHANDWHTAPALYAVWLRRRYEAVYGGLSTLLTVHNLPYLGSGAEEALQAFGLPPAEEGDLPKWARHLPLPLGLMSADFVNTVSTGYAREILTPEYGLGLEDFLKRRQDTLFGIINGLDLEQWNPETDPNLPATFHQQNLAPRVENKLALQERVGLPLEAETPLLAMIGRMDHQKGVDIAIEALHDLEDCPWQAVILGKGDAHIEAAATELEKTFPQRVRVRIEYNAPLGNLIYGGADMLLIPSRYEPCGLTQMIAMRYGCVPVARETGGLADTVCDYDRCKDSTGFLFSEPTARSLIFTLRRALTVYGDQRRWKPLQQRGMRRDFSWQRSAEEYYQLYQALLKRKPSDTIER